MAELVKPPTKYSPYEWYNSNFKNYNNAEKERATAESIQLETQRLTDETDELARQCQEDASKKLSQRLQELNFWKDEVQSQVQAVEDEIQAINNHKAKLENALDTVEHPYKVALSCVKYREERDGIDLVHDEVEINLLKEIEVIDGVRSVLKRTIEEAVEQVRRLRSAKYYLQKDLADKNVAIKIDDTCHKLRNTDVAEIGLYEGVTDPLPHAVTPSDWTSFSDTNVKKSESEKQASVSLRSVIVGILDQTYNDLVAQCKNVDLAFKKRVEECLAAKERLTLHLQKVEEDIGGMETNIAKLKKAIQEKLAPLKVAHTRLAHRNQRPNMELTLDTAQYQLVNEVQNVESAIKALEAQLKISEDSLKALVRNELELQEDIRIKSKSLHIDDELCKDLRSTIDYTHY